MKGILMKPEGIKTTAEGRKTVTRRVIKPQPKGNIIWFDGITDSIRGAKIIGDSGYYDYGFYPAKYIKPRYQVGETVYIKEAYSILDYQLQGQWEGFAKVQYVGGKTLWIKKPRDVNVIVISKHTPMMMPEWAARYFILIKDVRAERLQEITEEDALAEGMAKIDWPRHGTIIAYGQLWNSINKDYPWESNPWLFRYEFELKEKEKI